MGFVLIRQASGKTYNSLGIYARVNDSDLVKFMYNTVWIICL